jgi:hypothetical protein
LAIADKDMEIKGNGMTPIQMAHVASAFPECRSEMALFLEAGVDVVIGKQNACGPDVPPIAIAVAVDQAFWVDCCDTVEKAKALATTLGLRVVA